MPLAYPKPEPRRRTKARRQRAEAAVKRDVRAHCVSRDGSCRIGARYWADEFSREVWAELCSVGASEWCHLLGHRRSQTRGQAPADRHDTRHTLILCRRHHTLEERGRLLVTYQTSAGCDGPLTFTVKP